jgi:hypothetical protein
VRILDDRKCNANWAIQSNERNSDNAHLFTTKQIKLNNVDFKNIFKFHMPDIAWLEYRMMNCRFE